VKTRCMMIAIGALVALSACARDRSENTAEQRARAAETATSPGAPAVGQGGAMQSTSGSAGSGDPANKGSQMDSGAGRLSASSGPELNDEQYRVINNLYQEYQDIGEGTLDRATFTQRCMDLDRAQSGSLASADRQFFQRSNVKSRCAEVQRMHEGAAASRPRDGADQQRP
jgi:hypothetical protein